MVHDIQLMPHAQRVFPQQGLCEPNEQGLPVMSMHNAKMVTLALNMMNVPRFSTFAVGHAATRQESDAEETLDA